MSAVPDNRHIVRDTDDDLPIHPHGVVPPGAVDAVLDAAVHGNDTCLVETLDLPGVAVGHPVVRFFSLIAAVNRLLEPAVLVIEAVSVPRHAHGGQRVQKTGRQATEAAVAQ